MVDFLNALLPCRFQHSKRLISHDIHSNIYHNKFTYRFFYHVISNLCSLRADLFNFLVFCFKFLHSVEIVPVSKDSIVCLSKKVANQLGGINPLCVVSRVTSAVHLIDPASAQGIQHNSSVVLCKRYRILTLILH